MTTGGRGVMALVVTVVACGAPVEPDVGDVRGLDESAEIVLAVGDDVQIEGTVLRMTVVSVENDSRCPIDAVCVWEGDAEVRLGLAAGTGPHVLHTLHLNPTAGENDAGGGGYLVTLVALEPPARAGISIEQDQYRVRLRVEPEQPPGRYSALRVVSGSVRPALRAGSQQAIAEAVSNTSAAPPRALGSAASTS